MGKIKIYENGTTYYVESIMDAVTRADYGGCPTCHRILDTLSNKCPHCGEDYDGSKAYSKGSNSQAA